MMSIEGSEEAARHAQESHDTTRDWNKSAVDNFDATSGYRTVAVLLIRWADWLDPELHTVPEVDELRRVFGDKYGFATEVIVLDVRQENPQAQLTRELSNFIFKYDGPQRTNLLIAYYSGHAFITGEDGAEQFYMSGKQRPEESPFDTLQYEPMCAWRTLQLQLQRTQADVLNIIDACYAMHSVHRPTNEQNDQDINDHTDERDEERNDDRSHAPDNKRSIANEYSRNGTRAFETLAAGYKYSPLPGPRSFTRALINALVDAHEQGVRAGFHRFDTLRLQSLIAERMEQRRPSHRVPPLHSYDLSINARRILLKPLAKPLDTQSRPTGSPDQEDSPSECESDIDDAGSIFSEMSIASSVSSIQSESDSNLTEELIRAFTYNVFHTLELASLSTAALAEPKIGSVRFVRNFRRLIVQFGSNARKQGTMSTQLQAARLLRSKRISSRAAQLVVELIEADQLAAIRDTPEDEAFSPPEADRSLAWGGPNTTDASSDADGSVDGDDGGDIELEAYGSEQSDDEDDDEEDGDESILSQGTIDQVKFFLLKSEAYATFRTQLLDFVHEPYKKRLYAALRDSEIISDSGAPISPEAKFGLVKELAWVPPILFSAVFEVQRPRLSHLQVFVEDSLGEVWDWWPLRQRVRSLKTGYCRLSWVTPSGRVRSLDITTDAHEAFEKAIRKAPAFLNLTDADKQAVANSKQSTRTGAAVNQAAASSTSPAQGVANNNPGQSSNARRATSPSNASAGPAGTSVSASYANTHASAGPPIQPDSQHVYLCVKTGSDHDYHLLAIRSDQFRRDGDFFAELRSQYLEARGWWRNTFSWWRYDHCEFYRFYKYAIERSEPRHADFPADTDLMYDCEPSPPESRPPEGPVSPGEFRDRFYHCYACHSWHRHRRMVLFNTNDDYVLKALPKRKQVLEMGDGKREYFWGIYAKERRCFRWVVAYATLANVPGLVFVFLWLFQWKHAGDLQGATVLAQVSIALSIAFVGAVWADKG